MDEAGGWFAYFRAFKRLPFHPSQNGEVFSPHEAGIDLIDQAAWQETNKTVGVRAIVVSRGQVLASVQALAQRWRWGWHKADRFLCLLEDLDLIGQSELKTAHLKSTRSGRSRDEKMTMRRRMITISNYDAYKDSRRLNSEQTAKERQPDGNATARAENITPVQIGGLSARTKEHPNKRTTRRAGLLPDDPDRADRLARYQDATIVAGE